MSKPSSQSSSSHPSSSSSTTPAQGSSSVHSCSDVEANSQSPGLYFNDDGMPVSAQFDDPYFSLHSGIDESRYVFLQHNGLPERWHDFAGHNCAGNDDVGHNSAGCFEIVETGFGSGLNFLITWQSFRQHLQSYSPQQQHQAPWLNYTSVEKYPLSKAELRQALAPWSELDELSEQLLDQYPPLTPGFHQLIWPEQRIRLTLIIDDVHQALPQLSGPVHAWYLDGFAPSKNPQMWQPQLFSEMRRLACLHPNADTSIATFTAAGFVRRGLLGAGFAVKRVPGFGRKREMLAGRYQCIQGPERPALQLHKPWLLSDSGASRATLKPTTKPAAVTVIGAGIAGCSTARSLAERGIRVTLLDRHGIAQQGSGNPQGGFYIKLGTDSAQHSDFYRQAFHTGLIRTRQILGEGDDDNPYWRQCGVLQLAYDDKEARRQASFIQRQQPPADLVYGVDQAQASELAGLAQPSGGLFLPQAGWVSPGDFCQQLIQHPLIEFEQADVQQLEQQPDGWLLSGSTLNTGSEPEPKPKPKQWQPPQVVIANAYDAKTLLPDAHLPVKRIRGQLSVLDAEQCPGPSTVLCARSYMPPAFNGKQCLGATYHLNDDDQQVRDSDHQQNLDHLGDFGDHWPDTPEQPLAHKVIGGRVGFRCTTPDYLPMVGPVAETGAFIERFGALVKNAKRIPPVSCPHLPGLWLNIGHGSRGIASAPLSADVLSAYICGDSLPVSSTVQEALWPGRFLLRDMIRRKL